MTIHFDSSLVKIDKKGNQILSTTLDKGEKLASGQTYSQILRAGGVIGNVDEFAERDDEQGLTLDESGVHTVPETFDQDAHDKQVAETNKIADTDNAPVLAAEADDPNSHVEGLDESSIPAGGEAPKE